MILRISLLVFLICEINITLSQAPISEPTWPHHGYEDQMKAIPAYNEACELYKNGDTLGTLNSLKEAVSISFALTEAQLFLAKVYEDIGVWEKALVYYNSGIDFDPDDCNLVYVSYVRLGSRQHFDTWRCVCIVGVFQHFEVSFNAG